MKIKILLAFFGSLLFYKTIIAQSSYSDLKEYGFKGNVKNVSIIDFKGLTLDEVDSFIKKEDLINDSSLSSVTTHFFDKNGFLTKTTERLSFEYNGKKEFETLETTFIHKNGKKKEAIRKNIYGDTIDLYTYQWFDGYTYKETTRNLDNSYKVVSQQKLDSNYRDLSGDSFYYEYDSLMFQQFYINQTRNGEIISSSIKNSADNYTVTIKNIETDEYNNVTVKAIIRQDNQKLLLLSIREFYYYD